MVDSPVIIWAQGKSGWFEIRPAPEYEKIYETMTQGVESYFALRDIHANEDGEPTGEPLTIDRLVQQWISTRRDKLSIQAVKELWKPHAKFLLGHMKTSTGDIDWPSTPLHVWLAMSAPDVYKQYYPNGYIRRGFEANTDKAQSIVFLIDRLLTSSNGPHKHWTLDALAKEINKELKEKTVGEAREQIEVNAANILRTANPRCYGEPAVLEILEIAIRQALEKADWYELLEDVREIADKEDSRRQMTLAKMVVDLMHHMATNEGQSVQSMTIENLGKEMFRRYYTGTLQHATDLIKSSAEAVTACIAQWGLRYIHTPICKDLCWISQANSNDQKLKRQAIELNLKYRDRTKQKEWERMSRNMEPDEARVMAVVHMVNNMIDNDDIALSTLTVSELAEISQRQFELEDKTLAEKFVILNGDNIYNELDIKYTSTPLRNELIKAIAKFAMVMEKPAKDSELKMRGTNKLKRNSEEAEVAPTPRRGDTSKAMASIDLNTPIRAPSRHTGGKGAGKASTRRPVGTPLMINDRRPSPDDDEAGFQSPKRRKISIDDDEEEETDADDDESESESESESENEYELVIEDVDLGQNDEPNGPNNLWTCELKDCHHMVASAHTEEGKVKIKKHWVWHAGEIEKKYGLVKAAERPYLPVSHLLQRLSKVGGGVKMKKEVVKKDVNGNPFPKHFKRSAFNHRGMY